MRKVADLPTLAEMQEARASIPNWKPAPAMLQKDAKKKAKKLTDDEFRALIWKLDGARSRATGKPLVHGGTTDWHHLGEVDHSIPRSLAPDRIYDPSNALLLSKWENRARKTPCPRAPEFRMFDYTGPDDRRKPQHFVWRNEDGRIVKERIA
jgi:hypothetical protein